MSKANNMPKCLFLLLILCLTGCSDTNTQVPETVQKAFTAKYPNQTATWEQKPYGYEAIFTQNGNEYEAEFSTTGQWLETEYEVLEDQFSAAVLTKVRRENPSYTITKREIEITPQGTFYEVEIEQGSEQIELYFDGQANPAPNSNEDA
jgi:hypothetical protein